MFMDALPLAAPRLQSRMMAAIEGHPDGAPGAVCRGQPPAGRKWYQGAARTARWRGAAHSAIAGVDGCAHAPWALCPANEPVDSVANGPATHPPGWDHTKADIAKAHTESNRRPGLRELVPPPVRFVLAHIYGCSQPQCISSTSSLQVPMRAKQRVSESHLPLCEACEVGGQTRRGANAMPVHRIGGGAWSPSGDIAVRIHRTIN